MKISTKDPTLRTKKGQQIYVDYLKNEYDNVCIFCKRDLLIEEFKYWVLVKNRFPYSNVFKNHRMLASKAHVTNYNELEAEAKLELEELLAELDYDMCIINKKNKRSIPLHYHRHLVTLK